MITETIESTTLSGSLKGEIRGSEHNNETLQLHMT